MAREAWTDERLDDLKASVDSGFRDNREEFRALRAEIKAESHALRSEMREEFAGVRGEMGEIRAELGALNRTIHQFLFAIVGTIFLGFMGTISALITLT
jgi:hypothetical protein